LRAATRAEDAERVAAIWPLDLDHLRAQIRE
jgi:hypothetical protein